MITGHHWWCPSCKKDVDILIAHNVGVFCIECGGQVTPGPSITISESDIDYFPYMDDDNE